MPTPPEPTSAPTSATTSEPARASFATALPGLPRLSVCSDEGATRLLEFGRSILAFRDGELAREVGVDPGTVRRVDLAGARRPLMGRPRIDPVTRELHLLTAPTDEGQLHVRVSPGGLTRTIRSLPDAPGLVGQLDVTRDHVVLLADGWVGVADRTGVEARTAWFPVDASERRLAAVHVCGDTVVVHVTGASLVRWTLHRPSGAVDRHELDPAPHASPRSNRRPPVGTHRYLWTVGSGATHKHDLLTGGHWRHDFGEGRSPGALAFVADPDRGDAEDGGWLVGFVHDGIGSGADLVVLDAQRVERPAAAVIRVTGPVPTGAWIPVVQGGDHSRRI